MRREFVHSPIGLIRIESDGTSLTAITIGATSGPADSDPLTREAAAQIGAWFAGALARFDLPLVAPGTPRGLIHREAIAGIGYGETASYGELARRIGSGPRAVGQACRRNPCPIVIPCHRVLAAGGAIGHYSAGDGIATKRWLLDHERRKGRPHG